MTTTLHAHFQTYSTDCDGAISRDYVEPMNDEEQESEYGDIKFHNRVISTVVNTYSLMYEGSLKVTNEEDNGVRLFWHEATEEGGRSVEALICKDESCNLTAHGYRDHRAESMGY